MIEQSNISRVEAAKQTTGFPASVYRNAELGDCTNLGISERFVKLVIVGEPGLHPLSNVCEAENQRNTGERVTQTNAVRLVRRIIAGRIFIYAQPVGADWGGDVEGEKAGYMFGGNFIWSSDSRFRQVSEQPIPVHDRRER